MAHRRSTQLFLSISAVALFAACQQPGGPGASNALLQQAESCDDLRQAFVDDAIQKINLTADQYRDNDYGYYGRGEDSLDAGVGAPAPNASADGPQAHSETNTQVAGVDEADIVKFDGTRLFVVAGNRLRYLDSWPANETHEVASLEIEGNPIELFLTGDHLVVFSSVQDPRLEPQDCSSPRADGLYPQVCYGGASFTKVTTLAIEGENLRVVRELFFEGGYNTSRRYGDIVRVVLQQWGWYYDWTLPQIWTYLYDEGRPEEYEEVTEPGGYTWRRLTDAARLARIENYRTDAIAAARVRTIEDWVPEQLERISGVIAEQPIDCSSQFFPEAGLVDYGLTQIIGFDLADVGSAIETQAIRGYTGAVYSNQNAFVLAQPDWSTYQTAYINEQDFVTDRTLLHQFAIGEGGSLQYQGSTFTAGSIRNQFNLDERNGVLRVAATETRSQVWRNNREPNFEWQQPTTRNLVSTYRADGLNLNQEGELNLVTDNESIQSVRFMDNIAYVVTFRQTDPLFAVDLSDSRNPRLLGELHIPGFSTYIHPLDASHLLTIGYDADAEGRRLGLALQIFDVSSPTSPQLVHRYVYSGSDWGYSEANWDHKAFTFFDERGLLAFPFVSYGNRDGSDWSYRSSLEVFQVSAETGFAPVASLSHDSFVASRCVDQDTWRCSYWDMSVRRGVFADDFVYSISNGGVKVHDTRNPSVETASVAFDTALETPSR